MLRSVLAVFAGVLTLTLLTVVCDFAYGRVNPHAMTAHGGAVGLAAVVMFVYIQIINLVGGFVTGRVAFRKPAQHAAWLGLMTTVLSILVAKMLWHDSAHWYLVACAVFALPLTTLGGGLAKK